MDPEVYVPLYLERTYIEGHTELTSGARDLLRNEIAKRPEAYAEDDHARALISYQRTHSHMLRELARMEELADEEFERTRARLFDNTRRDLGDIIATDPRCIDARLLDIQLANIPLDECLIDMMSLEQEVRAGMLESRPGFDPAADGLGATGDSPEFPSSLASDPELIGWLHIVEALAHGSLVSARYRAAANYARTVMRAKGYPGFLEGTLLLALARLEDEESFFACARDAAPELSVEDSPWYLLGRTLLLYKLGRFKNAKRALRDFAARCEGGAFFLLNPTYITPYLPVRPDVRESWKRVHQAVWEADAIIADAPDFTAWAESVEGIVDASERFARRYGF